MVGVRVTRVGPESASMVSDLVGRLLRELGEEGDEAGTLDTARLAVTWWANPEGHLAFVVLAEDESPVGVLTLTETFAIYANGKYGVINEMHVAPAFRSRRVGALLLQAAEEIGRTRGWRRIDVTAPESPRWKRARSPAPAPGRRVEALEPDGTQSYQGRT